MLLFLPHPLNNEPTLAPIWLPHCPAWMCTISRMVPLKLLADLDVRQWV